MPAPIPLYDSHPILRFPKSLSGVDQRGKLCYNKNKCSCLRGALCPDALDRPYDARESRKTPARFSMGWQSGSAWEISEMNAMGCNAHGSVQKVRY